MFASRSSIRSMLAVASVCCGLGSACGVPQSDECAQYVACASYADVVFDLTATNTTAYGPEGTCWKDEATGTLCTEACEDALTDLREAIDLSGEPRGDCG